jgi:hypothetical protein
MLKSTNSIKIMGDYSSSGLWDLETGIMVELSELGIPFKLKKRIEKWSKDWDSFFTVNFDNLEDSYLRKILFRKKEFRRIRKEQYVLAKILGKHVDNVILFDDLLAEKNLRFLLKVPSLSLLGKI